MMTVMQIKWLERIVVAMGGVILILILVFGCSGCIAIPLPLEESIHSLHKGNILICEDYINLLLEVSDSESAQNKLKIIREHLNLSKELDNYVKGKGGKIKPPWSK